MFDFGLGSSEILVIAVVALIVLGPKDLPRLLRTIGQYMRKIQGMAREFQNHLNEAAKEAGVDDVKKEVKGMTNFTVTTDLDKQGSEIKRAIEQSAPKPAAAAASNGAGGKEEAEKPAPAALARPIAATEPVAPPKAKPVRQKAEPKPKPASKPAPKPKAKPKADPAREAAKS